MYILMCMAKNIALALVRQDLSGIVDEVATTHERVVVTRHGEPAAVLIAIDDLEALEETLEILADAALVTSIHRSLKSTKRYSMTQVRDRLAKRSPA
jgi:prevent-host-death family protein